MSKIHKLYLLEGMEEHAIHSLALEQKDLLELTGRKVTLYQEGRLHPADMESHAYLSMDEYYEFLHDVFEIWRSERIGTKEELTEQIATHTTFANGHAIIAHRMLSFPSSAYASLLSDLSDREIYNGKLSYSEFLALHLGRFKQFTKQALGTPNAVYLFTNTLFKNHITELMGFYDMEDERILSHLTMLLRQVLPLNPCLIYLKADSLSNYLESLTDESRYMLKDQVERSNYGKLHGLKGTSGILSFLENRRRLEELSLESFSEVLPELDIDCREKCL